MSYAPRAAHHAVLLTEHETRYATWVGRDRFAFAQSRRCAPGKGPSATCRDARLHVRGTLCELGASFVLDLPWHPGIGELKRRDLVDIVEVRSTRFRDGELDPDGPYLIVKPFRPDGTPVPGGIPHVLALLVRRGTRRAPRAYVALLGWCFASDAFAFPLQTRFGDASHWVPQSSLRAIDDLRAWVHLVLAGESLPRVGLGRHAGTTTAPSR